MPDKDRIDKLEETAALLVEHAKISLQRAQIADKRLDNAEDQIGALRETLKETDARLGQRIEALVSAIGEYIRSDREQRAR